MKTSSLLLLLFLWGACATPDLALRTPSEEPLEAREAVLILPGLAFEFEGAEDIHRFAELIADEGFDVYVPNYSSKASIDEGVAALATFVQEQRLERYGRLHVFAYILGGATLNRYLQQHPLPNLASVVYDRGPLQERADVVATTHVPFLTKMLIGDVVFDLAASEYVPFEADIPIGLVIENRATWFVRVYRDETLALGPVSFAPETLEQRYDDHLHVWLDHFEMYHSFDVVGPAVLHFFRHGRFPDGGRKVPFEGDPFAS